MTTQHIILEIIVDKNDSALTMECITNHSRSVLQRIAWLVDILLHTTFLLCCCLSFFYVFMHFLHCWKLIKILSKRLAKKCYSTNSDRSKIITETFENIISWTYLRQSAMTKGHVFIEVTSLRFGGSAYRWEWNVERKSWDNLLIRAEQH